MRPYKEQLVDEIVDRLKPICNELSRLSLEKEKHSTIFPENADDNIYYLGWDPRQKNHHLKEHVTLNPTISMSLLVQTHIKNINTQLFVGVGKKTQHYICNSIYINTAEGGTILYETAVLDEEY